MRWRLGCLVAFANRLGTRPKRCGLARMSGSQLMTAPSHDRIADCVREQKPLLKLTFGGPTPRPFTTQEARWISGFFLCLVGATTCDAARACLPLRRYTCGKYSTLLFGEFVDFDHDASRASQAAFPGGLGSAQGTGTDSNAKTVCPRPARRSSRYRCIFFCFHS